MQIEILIPKSVAAPSRILAHTAHECDSALERTQTLAFQPLPCEIPQLLMQTFAFHPKLLTSASRKNYRDKMENKVSNALEIRTNITFYN